MNYEDEWAAENARRQKKARRVTVCLCCQSPLTWREIRKQFGRLIKNGGVTVDQAKKLSPRCGVCVNQWVDGRETKAAPPRGMPMIDELKKLLLDAATHEGRTELPVQSWGRIKSARVIADGIAEFTTDRHGGIVLSQERFDEMPYPYREWQPCSGPLVYEEDCDAWVVIVAFSELFTDERVATACRTIRSFAESDEDFADLLPYLPDVEGLDG